MGAPTLQAVHPFHPGTTETPRQALVTRPLCFSVETELTLDSCGHLLDEALSSGGSGLPSILKVTQKPPSGTPAAPLSPSPRRLSLEPLLPRPTCHQISSLAAHLGAPFPSFSLLLLPPPAKP